MRAVQLYIQYDFHVRSVMRELGYPKERHQPRTAAKVQEKWIYSETARKHRQKI